MYASRRKPSADLFWSHVRRGAPDACWPWMLATTGGYGMVAKSPHGRTAHRVAWILTHGPVADDIQVCHDCPDGDNRLCCNPSHLFLGTGKDNMQDAADKDTVVFGERQHLSVLSEDDVITIRSRYIPFIVTLRDLAEEYGVNPSTIARAVSGKTWRRVV